MAANTRSISGNTLGLLVLRIGLGALMMLHYGWPMFRGGASVWAETGRAVSYLGIHFLYPMWGFLAMASELIGGACLILGLFFRPAAFCLLITMAVATIWNYYPFGGLTAAAGSLALAIVFLGMALMGPGPFSLDEKIR